MNLELAKVVNDLEKNIDKLPAYSQKFAMDLVRKAYKWDPSEKQEFYIRKLAKTALTPKEAPVYEDVDFGNIIALFNKAKSKLRAPKVRLMTHDGDPVQLKVATNRSKYAGQIVVSDGGPFGQNIWYGNIDTNGKWRKTAKTTEEVTKLVKAFAKNPAKIASKYGKTYGGCSFCSRPLTDDRSLEVGYGPVCAENYELPWG